MAAARRHPSAAAAAASTGTAHGIRIVKQGQTAGQKRFFVGVVYNLLINDDTSQQQASAQTMSEVMASSGGDRKRLYHHPAVRLPRNEMGRDNGDAHWRDRPLLLDHGNTSFGHKSIGRIHSSRIVGDRVEVSGEVTDPDVIQRLDKGNLLSLSVGYKVEDEGHRNPETGAARQRFHVQEVSLCEKPFFEGCGITVLASKGIRALSAPHPSFFPRPIHPFFLVLYYCLCSFFPMPSGVSIMRIMAVCGAVVVFVFCSRCV